MNTCAEPLTMISLMRVVADQVLDRPQERKDGFEAHH